MDEMDVFWQKAHISKLENNANSATIDTILKVFKALKEEINFNVKLEALFVKLTCTKEGQTDNSGYTQVVFAVAALKSSGYGLSMR